jgi:hypothetical protein
MPHTSGHMARCVPRFPLCEERNVNNIIPVLKHPVKLFLECEKPDEGFGIHLTKTVSKAVSPCGCHLDSPCAVPNLDAIEGFFWLRTWHVD